ncbi:MAG: TVP38/TMEM64 family protein [Verrucomicrobiota bacterium]
MSKKKREKEVMSENSKAKKIAWLKISLVAAGVLIVFIAMSQLPMRDILERVDGFIKNLGAFGMVVYGLIYIVATVFLVPGSAITLAAGLIFGLWWGTLVVSLSSTMGAALAFLIARYLARARIEKMAEKSPRFGAVDRAVSEGGWKIVGLLRLSPAIPFNLQNYLYGLTGIRFWPCILTSWVAMIPGTFMYVYLGYLGRAGVETAAGEGGTNVSMWVLRIVGFLATVAVTVYVTRLARSEIKKQTAIEDTAENSKGSTEYI